MAFVTFKTYMYGCTRAVTKARGWGFLSMATMNMIPINTFIGKKRKTEPQQLPQFLQILPTWQLEIFVMHYIL